MTSITIDKFKYDIDGNRLKISKIKKNKDKLFIECSIKDIEILYFNDKNPPSLYFVTPTMDASFACTTREDPNNVKKLYDALIEAGATLRLTSLLKAAFTKHSKTIELNKKRRKEKLANIQSDYEKQKLRKSCKMHTEEKYTCLKCNNVWYVNAFDKTKNLYNATTGTIFGINNLKQLDKCTKCGSVASKHNTVKFWVDKKGNTVDFEE